MAALRVVSGFGLMLLAAHLWKYYEVPGIWAWFIAVVGLFCVCGTFGDQYESSDFEDDEDDEDYER